ncbi:MAG: hypothetical protein ABSG28_09790 [Methanoregula sp.]|uniref:hypothetical protein n=1 Tax=Methanoregula sp. TaxID=2052170 RepID=UPI003C25D975
MGSPECGAAVQVYRDRGIGISPGMKIRYVVADAWEYRVEPAWRARSFDCGYYQELIDKAYVEITFAYSKKPPVKFPKVIHV